MHAGPRHASPPPTDPALAYLCRIAAQTAGAGWAAIVQPDAGDPAWHGPEPPPAALAAAALAGPDPAPDTVAAEPVGDGGGWVGRVALPGGGRLVLLAHAPLRLAPPASDDLLEIARLAAARLGVRPPEASGLARFGHFRLERASGAVQWSDEVRDLFGYGGSDCRPSLAMMLADFPERAQTELRLGIARSWESGEEVTVAATILRRDGAQRDVLVRLRADAPADLGRRDALSGVMLDVTGVRAFDDRLERERELLRTTLDHMDQGLLVVEPDMSVPVLNHRVVELLRLPEAFIETRPSFTEILNYQKETGMISLDTLSSSINTYILNVEDLPEVHVYERETFDGLTLEVRTTRLPGGGFVRTFTDQTARRRRDEEIARVHAEHRRLFENAAVGIYRALPDGRPVRANPAFARMNGYGSEAEMLAALDATAEAAARSDGFLGRLRREGLVQDQVSQISRRRTGELIWVSETAWAVRDEAGEMVAFEGTMVEATERKRAEDAVAHMALHDGLTGLPNRLHFVERLAALAGDGGAGRRLAVAIFDLDRFKGVNDALGHPAGDALLRVLAARIAALVGPDDLAARFGGDEFALVKLDAGREEAAELAAALLDALRAPVRLENRDVAVGVSVGIALAPLHAVDPTELMKCADVALYRAKAEGGDRWRIFGPEMAAEAQVRRRLEMDLRAALDRDEFALVYQPLVCTQSGEALGFEALLRWTRGARGPIEPETFIAVAEETGLIAPIGAWVLAQACADAAGWAEDLGLWVNVSALQLADGRFEETLAAALASSGLPARRLVLEITETSLIDERADLAPRIARLRALGTRTALDDFGTGYSSLGYLRRFAFDVIKIDRSFVQNLADPATAAIVMSVLDLARRLDLLVVAEGVETPAQLAALLSAGCDLVQGHLFGPPVDAGAVAVGAVPRWDMTLSDPGSSGSKRINLGFGQVNLDGDI